MLRRERRISGWGLLPPESFAGAAAGLVAEQGFGLGWTRGSGEGNGGAAGREGSPESGASIHGLGRGRGRPERENGRGGSAAAIRPWRGMWSSEASGEALRGVVAAEELEGSTYSRGRAREGGRGGTRRATCPCAGEGAGAAKAHGEAREGDEGEVDERQRVMETSNAHGGEEEADRGKYEDDGHGTHCSVVGTARRRRKRRGRGVQANGDNDATPFDT